MESSPRRRQGGGRKEKTTYGVTPTVACRLVHVCAAQLASRGATVVRVASLIDPNVVLVQNNRIEWLSGRVSTHVDSDVPRNPCIDLRRYRDRGFERIPPRTESETDHSMLHILDCLRWVSAR